MTDRKGLLAYAAATFHTQPDYPWRKYPTYAVLRHENNGKWYALLMTLPKARLGLTGMGDVDVVNLKCDHVLDVLLRKAPGTALPAYHMSRKHWITIVLDTAFPDAELYALVNASYRLTG